MCERRRVTLVQGVVPAPTQGCTLKSPTACSGHVRGQCGILWYGSSGCTNPNQRGSVSSPGAPRVHREEDGVTLGSTRIAFSSLPPPHSTLVRGMPTKYVGNIFATCLKTEFYWKDIIKLHPRLRYPEKGDGPLEIAIWYFTLFCSQSRKNVFQIYIGLDLWSGHCLFKALSLNLAKISSSNQQKVEGGREDLGQEEGGWEGRG